MRKNIIFKTDSLEILKDDMSCAIFETISGEIVLLTHGSEQGTIEHANLAIMADHVIACFNTNYPPVAEITGKIYSRFFITNLETSTLEISDAPIKVK